MDLFLLFLVYSSSSAVISVEENQPAKSPSRHAPQEVILHTQKLFDDHITQPLTAEETCTDLWFIPKNGTCHCGSTVHGSVTCNEHTKEVTVLDCYCMTADSATNQTVVGECYYNCANLSRNAQYQDNVYHQAPSNCSLLHRRGTLCGECNKDYFLPAYSYDMECMQCNHPHSWWLYTAAAFLPLTVFIVIVLVFRISVVSPEVRAFVFFGQLIAAPINVRILLLSTKHLSPLLTALVKVYTTVYGIWNLDFFRTVFPGICLHLTTLQVLTLDYLVAVYPMLLMVIAYTLVELHGYGFKPVILMWRPFHYFFARFRREWDIQTSIIDAFVTFFILSTTKLLSVSFDLLIPTQLHTASGQSLGMRLYYDPNIEYMKREHLPYALLALIVLGLFILLPFCLLVFSSFRCVRKLFRKCRLRIRVLEDFLYAFQQYYKDGSNRMIDSRWYAAYYIMVSFIVYPTYIFTLGAFTYICSIFLYSIGAAIILIVEPYKQEYTIYNVVDCVLLLWVALFCTSVVLLNFAGLFERIYLVSTYLFITFLCTVPLVYITAVVIRWIWKRSGQRYCRKCQTEKDIDESLPDRICRSGEYKDNNSILSQ